MSERFLQVYLDTTARCNLRCRMCLVAYQEHQLRKKPPHIADRLRSLPQEMSRDLFLRIAADIFPRAKTLYLSCGFEPLMNKDFGWFLEQTGSYRIPNVGFTTNGVLLTEDVARQCIEAPVHEVSVSLDGARRETFESIRPGARWDHVLGNIRQLVQMRDAAGSLYPRLRVNFVLMRRNIQETVEFVELAHNLGADVLDFRHVVVFDIAHDMREESLFGHRDLANVWLARAKARADELGLQIAYLPTFPRRPGLERVWGWWRRLRRSRRSGPSTSSGHRPRCVAPWETLVITHLGFVGPCVGWLRDPPVGYLARQTLEDVLNGPQMARLRDGLLGRAPLRDSCAACPTISSRSTEPIAFTEIEIDHLDKIWLETYAQEFGWDLGASSAER